MSAPLIAAAKKVPIAKLSEDGLSWVCLGCGGRSGITSEGADLEEPCAPDCWVDALESAIFDAERAGVPVREE